MELWIQTAAAVVSAVLASSGLWACLIKRGEKNGAERRLLGP